MPRVVDLARVFVIFLPMAAIGTVSHEMGHIAAARARGYETVLHYGSMNVVDGWDMNVRDEMLMTVGGPASNMLIGTVGLLWLAFLRMTSPRAAPMGVAGWCATVLALFWSRQVFNASGHLMAWVTADVRESISDEPRLARMWEVSELITAGIPCVLGLAVCVAVLVLHSSGQRLTLLLAGPAGCVAGFALWYGVLGPQLLP